MNIEIEIHQSEVGNRSITATIKKNGKFYTEIGCADISELFEILASHEISEP